MNINELNADIEYEKFAQEIYQALLDSEDIKPIKVQHNVDIVGRSGCKHQLDVYWEYQIAGVTHRVAIECKNYKTSNVSIGRIRDFYGALTDIGNINGIFVCKNGYQAGAAKFANYYGLNLMELRVPIDSDWNSRLKKIQIDISLILIENVRMSFELDNVWIRDKYSDIKSDHLFEISGFNNKIFIKDKDGSIITDLLKLEEQLPRSSNNERDREYEYKWDEAYIQVKDFEPIKILSIKYIYDVRLTDPEQLIISGKDTAKAILKDVKTGTIKFFDRDGSIK